MGAPRCSRTLPIPASPRASGAPWTPSALTVERLALTRFAGGYIHQNVSTETPVLTVRAVVGARGRCLHDAARRRLDRVRGRGGGGHRPRRGSCRGHWQRLRRGQQSRFRRARRGGGGAPRLRHWPPRAGTRRPGTRRLHRDPTARGRGGRMAAHADRGRGGSAGVSPAPSTAVPVCCHRGPLWGGSRRLLYARFHHFKAHPYSPRGDSRATAAIVYAVWCMERRNRSAPWNG